MKVVVFSAHPDDLEIGCAGTLKRLQDQGADILSIITVKPSAEANTNRSKEIVASELQASYNLSKFRLKVFDTPLHVNGRPNLVCNNNVMTDLAMLVEDCDIAILPNPQDYHQDHKITYELAFPLVRNRATEIWCMESWPYCHYYKTNTTNLYYDISDVWEFKQELLKCYSSYIGDSQLSEIKTANAYAGHKNKAALAEAFTIINKYVK